ncbi:M24 family metallopeptidase [Bradyrhizobium cytisi]|nr:Xaa-Pro peptidase family protein [Bradyrhizobium cytisi]
MDFSAGEFEMRHTAVRRAMAEKQIDFLLVIAPTNIQYLIGTRTKSYQEFQCLLFPLDPLRPKVVLARLAEVAEYTDLSLADAVHGWGGREPEDPILVLKNVLAKHGYSDRRVGLEIPCHYLSVQDHAKIASLLGDRQLIEATNLVENIKLVKSPAEIALIRKARDIALRAMKVAEDTMRPGVSEREIAAVVYRSLLTFGGDLPASPINLVSGDRTCYGHGAPTDRRLEVGDFINIEFGAAYNRYCTTIGRQFVLGEPTARMVELYHAARKAADACIRLMQPGTPAVIPHRAAKQVCLDLGLDEYRLHTTGYGIAPGYPPSWGESIHLFEDSPYTLMPGMMLSVEPPIFIHKERLGARIIDNVLVCDDGPELLTTYNRDLIMLPV